MGREELFEAISHPLRVEMLRRLAGRPMGFSELKRELGIDSSGKLDFHLRKLEGLVSVNEEGKYCLTGEGYAALQAVESIRRHGWERRALALNLAAYAVVNAYSALAHFDIWLWTVLPVSTAWIALYTYWAVRRRGVLRW